MSNVYRTYVIKGMTLAQARRALEQSLGISFDERDSSWYASLYYLSQIDKDHAVKLNSIQDFEGEPLEQSVPMSDLLLEANGLGPDDQLLMRMDELPFLCSLK